jgi:hypothetical protein
MGTTSPRTVVSIAVVLAVLGSPLPTRGAADSPAAKAPATLDAPKDFAAAVRSLEAATGAAGAKLHELPLDEARAFAVEPALAERILDANHAAFKRAGIYLFRHERSFGLAGDKDQLAVVRTADWKTVVERVGTAGPKGQPSSEKIAAWLEALAKEDPFELREIGSDYVAGRFERVPKDPAAMAKRCAEFAPDLVAGRASTLELLAREISANRSLYLIW